MPIYEFRWHPNPWDYWIGQVDWHCPIDKWREEVNYPGMPRGDVPVWSVDWRERHAHRWAGGWKCVVRSRMWLLTERHISQFDSIWMLHQLGYKATWLCSFFPIFLRTDLKKSSCQPLFDCSVLSVWDSQNVNCQCCFVFFVLPCGYGLLGHWSSICRGEKYIERLEFPLSFMFIYFEDIAMRLNWEGCSLRVN